MQRRNDLLYQLSNTTYEVNAQGRTTMLRATFKL